MNLWGFGLSTSIPLHHNIQSSSSPTSTSFGLFADAATTRRASFPCSLCQERAIIACISTLMVLLHAKESVACFT